MEPFKVVCVYETISESFKKDKEEFRENIAREIQYGNVDALTVFMEEYDRRNYVVE